MSELREKLNWHDRWEFRKYASQEDYEKDNPFEVNVVEDENMLVNVGINRMWDLITGESALHFDAGNTEIGVGDNDGADPEAATDDDLQGAQTAFEDMDGGYPQSGSDQRAVFRATFGGAAANYPWQEFVIRRGVILNRLVSDQGTKANLQVWQVTVTVTLS